MEELWSHKKWKYFINLTGQEFPLKTNLELVRILTAYNGANDLEGTIKRWVLVVESIDIVKQLALVRGWVAFVKVSTSQLLKDNNFNIHCFTTSH